MDCYAIDFTPLHHTCPEEQISVQAINRYTHRYNQQCYHYITDPQQISLKSKRQIFSLLRASKTININDLLPVYGITIGELMFMTLPKLSK